MYLDELFPIDISFGAIGGLIWATDVTQNQGGFEYREATRSQPGGSWEVSHAARSPDKWPKLIDFFAIAQGRANTFRFKDPIDNLVAAGQGVFVMLTSTTFQMYKRYTFGAKHFDRKITKPDASVSVAGGSSPSIDRATGIVTVASGTPTSWMGMFYCNCRFDVDQMRANVIDKNGNGLIVGWQSIPIVLVPE